MDIFLERKKKTNDSECEPQHVLSQNTKRQKVRNIMSSLYQSSALLNVSLMLLLNHYV